MQYPIQVAYRTMRTACKAAGVPHFHPHDLRHRRLSLWHGQGIPAREIGDRAGQKQIATTLEIYTHTMPLDEVPRDAFLELLTAPPRATFVLSNAVLVGSPCGPLAWIGLFSLQKK